MVKVRVIGALGYGGIGIIELLVRHPEVEIVSLCDVDSVGTRLSELYPHLQGHCDEKIGKLEDELTKTVDVTFCATPDRVGMGLAESLRAKGSKVIDYSGDFRFADETEYREYARRIGLEPEHLCPDLLAKSEYGLTELNREKIGQTAIVGNPGCFAVSCILGMAPLFATDLIEKEKVICDCKTGSSGAGKKPRPQFHYPNLYENMFTYRLSGHQHVLEVELALERLAGTRPTVILTPQVVPLCRGIMSTLYIPWRRAVTEQELVELFRGFYRSSPFVRVMDKVENALVRQTNYCYLKPTVDERGGMIRVVSHIDNLMKGQSGSALQNMNVMFGLDETMGLGVPAKLP